MDLRFSRTVSDKIGCEIRFYDQSGRRIGKPYQFVSKSNNQRVELSLKELLGNPDPGIYLYQLKVGKDKLSGRDSSIYLNPLIEGVDMRSIVLLLSIFSLLFAEDHDLYEHWSARQSRCNLYSYWEVLS